METDLKYSTKVLVAWAEAIKGNKEINNWLLKNGYKELGIFVHALHNDEESRNWLMKNKYPHLITKDSPTQKVGVKASNKFQKIKHIRQHRIRFPKSRKS